MSETNRRRAMEAARKQLTLAGVPDPLRDVSALLVGAGAGVEDDMPPDVAARFAQYVARRVQREPVSHILGRRAFWEHEFLVTPDVLDPRPDTETLVEAALQAPFARVLDLGTGSGCILLSLLHERPHATGVGTDLSAKALAVAAQNADRVGVATRVTWRQSDWLAAVTGTFDLIVSNPPYITAAEMGGVAPEVLREPALALSPGGDGLDAYRAIARDAPNHLDAAGRLLVEIGPTQGGAVCALMAEAGLRNIAVLPDLDGRDRVVLAEKTSSF